ncbi:MAG: hypothetical protein LBG06_00690 [Deltaproteobacteria bacterium]|jgi:hypothetical protein|nr:hypothetical protein [Deltaproteobacteria bacterium]
MADEILQETIAGPDGKDISEIISGREKTLIDACFAMQCAFEAGEAKVGQGWPRGSGDGR